MGCQLTAFSHLDVRFGSSTALGDRQQPAKSSLSPPATFGQRQTIGSFVLYTLQICRIWCATLYVPWLRVASNVSVSHDRFSSDPGDRGCFAMDIYPD